MKNVNIGYTATQLKKREYLVQTPLNKILRGLDYDSFLKGIQIS